MTPAVVVFALGALGDAHAAASPSSAAPPGWHVLSLDLDVNVSPESRLLRVAGSARLRLGSTASDGPTLAFGPGGVTFDSARVTPRASVAYSAARDSLLVRLAVPPAAGAEVSVTFYGHTDRDLGRSLVRPQGAMISWGALWYPVVAWHPDSAPDLAAPGTTRITVPAAWRTLSPGVLMDSTVAGGTRTEVWRVTRPTARSFVAAEFVPVWTRVDSSPVAVYLLPRHAHRVREYADAIPRMVKTLAGFWGPYPFGGFGIAELPREVSPPGFGGRSEPGYFIAHTDALEGAGVNVSLFAHELTHMWFPNAVDSRPPGDDMMDEAIADYGVAVYREVTEGAASARRALVEGSPDYGMRAYFHQARLGVDEPLMTDYSYTIARSKGPMVYDMLRRRVGDSAFFGVWRELTARGGSASLADLRRLFVQRVPGDTGLSSFFGQWLDRRGAPVVRVARSGAGGVTLTQREAPPYQLDLPLRLRSSGRTRDTLVHVSGETQSLAVGAATYVELDPHDELLLWKPRFGPPPDARASWATPRWRAWMRDEIRWLMRAYEVQAVAVSVVKGGRVEWTARFGPGAVNAGPTTAALVDSMRTTRDTSSIRLLATPGDTVSLTIGRPAERVGVVAVARGGWGGRQLVMHVAQRVAIQYQWRELPK